jgi:hypothetical protein
VTGLSGQLSELEAEFPGYEFAAQPAWGGISISARRREGCARPGVYAVVTGDPDELRHVLLEDERASRQVTAGVSREGRLGCSGLGPDGGLAPG